VADLNYSDDALNVKCAFYRATAMVYVEGDDDVLFWHEVFAKVPGSSVEIESAGGSDQVDQYIDLITSGRLNAIAARDLDFLGHLRKTSDDPRVLYTFGYSIENSLYTADAIASLVRLWCKSPRANTAECANWLNDVARELQPLVKLDIANRFSESGAQTLGDNCTRLMTSQVSSTVCPHKVAAVVAAATPRIPLADRERAATSMGTLPDDIIRNIRGHFLASASLKYLLSRAKAIGRRIDVSSDSLYAAAMAHFGRVMGHNHPHQDHYLASASNALTTVLAR
jgi:hypothetical protein